MASRLDSPKAPLPTREASSLWLVSCSIFTSPPFFAKKISQDFLTLLSADPQPFHAILVPCVLLFYPAYPVILPPTPERMTRPGAA